MKSMQAPLDPLSKLGSELIAARPGRYERLVVGLRDAPGADLPAGLTSEQLFAEPAGSGEFALLTLAMVQLYHDQMESAHRIAQLEPAQLRTEDRRRTGRGVNLMASASSADDRLVEQTAAWIHAIIHRREGDFSNSRYWYRRCDGHPSQPTLARQIEELTRNEPANMEILRITANGFDGAALSKLVETADARPGDAGAIKMAVHLQQLEWRELLQACVRGAVGR